MELSCDKYREDCLVFGTSGLVQDEEEAAKR